ncbi:hypothetical protein [Bacteroides faecis]|jgi:hypothetical protein|uniref:hypothetical protein n=1 Tax=Bacteroides faecis TaxID=674529 RepID=UPI002054B368|nr:MAG TPA_asm: hypothetical protein [Bacteriophage sp.]
MNSKLDLRLESAKLAVMVDGITPENVISLSKEIEKYVMGEADLPEAYDPSEMLKNSMEMLNKRFIEDYDKNKELQAKADEVSTRTGGDA